jgi:hypothetical protein
VHIKLLLLVTLILIIHNYKKEKEKIMENDKILLIIYLNEKYKLSNLIITIEF